MLSAVLPHRSHALDCRGAQIIWVRAALIAVPRHACECSAVQRDSSARYPTRKNTHKKKRCHKFVSRSAPSVLPPPSISTESPLYIPDIPVKQGSMSFRRASRLYPHPLSSPRNLFSTHSRHSYLEERKVVLVSLAPAVRSLRVLAQQLPNLLPRAASAEPVSVA